MIGGGLRSHERAVTVDPGIEELEYIQYYIKTTSALPATPARYPAPIKVHRMVIHDSSVFDIHNHAIRIQTCVRSPL